MAEYTVTPTGGIQVGGAGAWSGPIFGGAMGSGCAIVEYVDNVPTPFKVGDVLYWKQQAERQGELYKIRIKAVYPFTQRARWGTWLGLAPDGQHQKHSALYEDTNGSYWNQSDLVPYADAAILIEEYEAKMQQFFYKKARC
jgi:hypothetical protein